MAKSVLKAPHFQNEEAAFAYVEAKLWPHGPACPHCGNADEKRIGRLQGATTRIGLRKCYECKKPFTVRQKTIFESSHLPLHLWLQVIHLMCASKKGISTNQIQRMLSCSMKTAWFLTHRIRAAMDDGSLPPMGSTGGTVEADETYFGKMEGYPGRVSGREYKLTIMTLVERQGAARSFLIEGTRNSDVTPILAANLSPNAKLMTDTASWYKNVAERVDVASHDMINHVENEYVRYAPNHVTTTNTVEGFYSIFKRGMKGVYQHCKERHLHRYLAEFDFRYSNRIALGVNDTLRADIALKGVKGKRLTYQTTAG